MGTGRLKGFHKRSSGEWHTLQDRCLERRLESRIFFLRDIWLRLSPNNIFCASIPSPFDDSGTAEPFFLIISDEGRSSDTTDRRPPHCDLRPFLRPSLLPSLPPVRPCFSAQEGPGGVQAIALGAFHAFHSSLAFYKWFTRKLTA